VQARDAPFNPRLSKHPRDRLRVHVRSRTRLRHYIRCELTREDVRAEPFWQLNLPKIEKKNEREESSLAAQTPLCLSRSVSLLRARARKALAGI